MYACVCVCVRERERERETGYSYFKLLLILFIWTFIAGADTDLIQRTCKSTRYYQLCVSFLKSDASSPKADARGLAAIMARVGVANATATATFLSSQLLSTAAGGATVKAVIKECMDKYSFAAVALQNCLHDLASESDDYASVHVLAAADYTNACHNAFRRSPTVAYPPELAAREDGLKHICDVVLSIIDTLEDLGH